MDLWTLPKKGNIFVNFTPNGSHLSRVVSRGRRDSCVCVCVCVTESTREKDVAREITEAGRTWWRWCGRGGAGREEGGPDTLEFKHTGRGGGGRAPRHLQRRGALYSTTTRHHFLRPQSDLSDTPPSYSFDYKRTKQIISTIFLSTHTIECRRTITNKTDHYNKFSVKSKSADIKKLKQ